MKTDRNGDGMIGLSSAPFVTDREHPEKPTDRVLALPRIFGWFATRYRILAKRFLGNERSGNRVHPVPTCRCRCGHSLRVLSILQVAAQRGYVLPLQIERNSLSMPGFSNA